MTRLLENIFVLIFFLMKLVAFYVILVLSGGIIFGISPANATLLALYNTYGKKSEDYHFKEAWSYFKASFLISNSFFGIYFSLFLMLCFGIWLTLQVSLGLFFVFVVIFYSLLLLYLSLLYALYLKLQVYFEISFKNMLKLIIMGSFLSFSAGLKWFLGTAICLFLASRFPLLLVVFLPIIWLLFTFDSLDPIYQKVLEKFV